MKYQNFKSDFVSVHKFYEQEDGAQVQKPVPDHVRLTFFTEERRGFIIVERNGAETDGCAVSDDGLTLSAYVPLSRKFLGMGELICEIAVINADADFPDSIRTVVTPVRMDVTLWPGETNDDSEVESDIVLGFITDTVKQAQTAAETAQAAAETAKAAAESAKDDAEQAASDASDSASAAAQSLSSMQSTLNGAVATATSEADDAKTAARAAQLQAETFAAAAETAAAALTTLVVQEEGQNTDKVMSQKAVTDDLNDIKDLDERLKTLLGYNATRTVVNLEVGESGKYVQCASRSAAANAAFAISKPFSVDACSELLIKTGFNPSDETHKALDITVIAIYEEIERQRTVQKTNDSGELLYYVVTVDEETGTKTVTQEETTENTGYPVYTVETYTETRYLPNNEDRFVSIPDSGYYVANLPQTCKVVISYKPGVSDTAVIIEKHGALANLISQVFGIYEHRTMVECMVSLEERIKSLEDGRGLLGNVTAGTVDVKELTKCLYPVDLYGHGVPAEANVPVNLPEGLPWDGIPAFKGQHYINLDAASGGFYYAVGNESVNDWKQA